MAGRKKNHKSKPSGKKRGRVGSAKAKEREETAMLFVGAFVGLMGASFANPQLSKISAIPTKAIGIAEAVAGIAGAMFVKHPFIKGLSIGVGIEGGKFTAVQFGLPGIAGVGVVDKAIEYRQVGASKSGLRNLGAAAPGGFPRANNVGSPQSRRRYRDSMAGVYDHG